MNTKMRQREEDVRREMAARTRRSFLTGGMAAQGGFAGFRWIESRRRDGEIPWPLRRSPELDERATRAYFRPARLAREFPSGSGELPRVNGDIGLADDGFDVNGWSLEVRGLEGEGGAASLSLADIQALPKADFVTEMKCVEGWSRCVRWGGARMRDFVARYQPAFLHRDDYVALRTPDGAYYVGLEMAAALHPQTLLCYEMDGRALEPARGAPLRLVGQVRDQKPEAHRRNFYYQHAPARLLGRTRIRLLLRLLNYSNPKRRNL